MFCPCSAIAEASGPPAPPSPAPTAAEAQLAPAPRGIGRNLYMFSVGGQIADWATTVHTQRPGGLVEENRLLRGIGPARLFAIKAGWGVGVAVLGDVIVRRAERHGPRWTRHLGRAMPIIAGGWGFYIAARNELRFARARGRGAPSP